MASVFKRDGSPVWLIAWKDPQTGKRKRISSRSSSKSVADQIAKKIEAECSLIQRGAIDPAQLERQKKASKPIAGHIDDYIESLLAKGRTSKHREQIASMLRWLREESKWKYLTCVTEGSLSKPLKTLRKNDAASRTINAYIKAARAFSRWAWKNGFYSHDPLGGMGLENPRIRRKLIRRAMTDEEFRRLIDSTVWEMPMFKVSGRQRALIYRIARYTGFRAEEIRTLVVRDVNVDARAITIRPEHDKAGRGANQPIPPLLAEDLQRFIAGREPGEPLIEVPVRAAEMLRCDLERAGVEFENDEGRVDFHSLRHTFITSLFRMGYPLSVIRILARHGSLDVTSRYAHASNDELRDAVDGLESAAPREAPSATPPQSGPTATNCIQPQEQKKKGA